MRTNKKSLLLLWLVCVLSSGSRVGYSKKSAIDCSPLYSELVVDAVDSEQFQKLWIQYATNKDNYRKLPRLTDTYEPRHADRSTETNTGLTISPDRSVCSKMVENLRPLVKRSAAKNFSPAEQKFLKALYAEALRQKQLSKVSYDDYINLAYYFSIAMTLKSGKEVKPRSEKARLLALEPELLDPSLSRKNWPPHLKRVIEQAPRILFVPTFTDLSKQDQNELRPYPIYYLGLTTEPFILDDFPNENEFFMHDVYHAMEQAASDIKSIQQFRGPPTSWLKGRIQFRNSLNEALAKVPNERLRKVIQEGWYDIFHEETRIPFTKKGLREGLERMYPPESLFREAHAMEGLSKDKKAALAKEALQWLQHFASEPP